MKNGIISSYSSNVLMSKTALPTQQQFLANPERLPNQAAFHDFIKTFVTCDDLTNTLLPTMEKAVLRSPELSLPSKIDLPAVFPV